MEVKVKNRKRLVARKVIQDIGTTWVNGPHHIAEQAWCGWDRPAWALLAYVCVFSFGSTPQPCRCLNIPKIDSAVLGAKRVTQDRVWLGFVLLENVFIAWNRGCFQSSSAAAGCFLSFLSGQ